MLLDGQRRRSHGHAGEARPAPSHNPLDAGRPERKKKKASSKTRPWKLAQSHAGSSEPKQEAARRPSQPDPLLTSDNVYGILRRHLSICLYTQRGPARPSSCSLTEAWGCLAGHPCRLQAAARNRRLLARNLELARSARRRGRSVACLATTPLLAPLMHPPPPLHGSSIYTHYYTMFLTTRIYLSLFSSLVHIIPRDTHVVLLLA